jgi:tRNA(adenine34) deaminase
MASDRDIHFMRMAVEEAVKGRETPGGVAVGAVLVRRGDVICTGFNEGEMRHDPTAHSEIVVIRRACGRLMSTSLEGATL